MRQNDLAATGRVILRFSYDSVRLDTRRCVDQIQEVLRADGRLAAFVNNDVTVVRPEMDPNPIFALSGSPAHNTPEGDLTYFDEVRNQLNLKTLRECQKEAFGALSNYFGQGGTNAACVMAVGAGKTALGVAASLGFAKRRAMVVTPGRVIRGTFDAAFDHQLPRNALYGLPGGPMIPGFPPPKVRTLDADEVAIRSVTRDELLDAHVIITNFHSLGNGDSPDDLLRKLEADDIDFIVVDEAHIAASESYKRLFEHFSGARSLLMSACFQRLDGKPIEADVVYRYRLVDSIADGNAKNLRVHPFAAVAGNTTYEMVWPDGSREEIVGREAILELLKDEKKLSSVTAKSHEPIRQVMRTVKACLEEQAETLYPVKPRVLFAALGERHAEQIAMIAEEFGIPCDFIHHSMTDSEIKRKRKRFESDSGDLQGLVQLKMLGQGYDFPAISVVVPMRPYGSFSEFYQFIGRGIRVINHPALSGRVGPEQQFCDVVYHSEMGLDGHVETIYLENDMDPQAVTQLIKESPTVLDGVPKAGTTGTDIAERPDVFVLFEQGTVRARIVHDEDRVEMARQERERAALSARYAEYAATTASPVSFDQWAEVLRSLHD
jgi:superfamily II DNA or RNA helicase